MSKIIAYSPLLFWKVVFIGILTSFLFFPTPTYDLSRYSMGTLNLFIFIYYYYYCYYPLRDRNFNEIEFLKLDWKLISIFVYKLNS